MPEFLSLTPPDIALSVLLRNLTRKGNPEWVEINKSLGRVAAEPVSAPRPLPSFTRSSVDGYAVQASDTYGAGESLPAYLRLSGEVHMGKVPPANIQPGNCMLIHTGGMLPGGADAVVMLEHTQAANQGIVEILRAVAPGENVIRVGEDVLEGQVVIPSGSRLRAAEIGGLAACGITRVQVTRQPRIAIISSGDEVVPLGEDIQPGQVFDVNTYSLSALIEQSGGLPIGYGIIPDEIGLLEQVAKRALEECDMVVFTAGSSASARDYTSVVINRLGKPGVLVHGVNVRPGKPTILAVCDGKAVIGLPGNPVSALVIARLFLTPVIEQWLCLVHKLPRPMVKARLAVNVNSQAGREEWVPVRLSVINEGYLAEPIFGKSNLIFTLARADGMVRIDPDATGINPGEIVDVILLI